MRFVEFLALLIVEANGVYLFWHCHVMEFEGWQLWFVLISATVVTMTAGIMMYRRIRRWL